ncbi:hypothetical protein J2X68_007245 [Streptomyces sp. 3330]|nr:hypothetical protein [Streptomyces sp. 3330]
MAVTRTAKIRPGALVRACGGPRYAVALAVDALGTVLAPAHALGRTLARFELSTGFGLAVSPAVITALAPHGPTALWGGLAGATLLSAAAVAAEKDQGTQPKDSGTGPNGSVASTSGALSASS